MPSVVAHLNLYILYCTLAAVNAASLQTKAFLIVSAEDECFYSKYYLCIDRSQLLRLYLQGCWWDWECGHVLSWEAVIVKVWLNQHWICLWSRRELCCCGGIWGQLCHWVSTRWQQIHFPSQHEEHRGKQHTHTLRTQPSANDDSGRQWVVSSDDTWYTYKVV